jgi:hypothetical protein
MKLLRFIMEFYEIVTIDNSLDNFFHFLYFFNLYIIYICQC